MSRGGVEDVQLRRTIRDRRGDEVTTEALVTFERCQSIPRTLGESSERGAVTLEGFTVFVPPQEAEWDASVEPDDRQVMSTDQIFVRGRWHSIEGEPADYWNRRGRSEGILIVTEKAVLA